MQIDGRTALVTGGASGLGEATCRVLAEAGAKVAVLDLSTDQAEAVAAEIGGLGLGCDVTDADATQRAFAAAAEHFGEAPRIVVNCAGIAPAARIVGREGKTAVELFRKVIEVNLIGSYNVMTFGVQGMLELNPTQTGERGVVINTASVAHEDGQLGQTAYAASKGGIASMCLPAARELAKPGIRVCAIAPGLFNTPMMAGLPEETTDAIIANIPFPHRLGDPAEYGQMVRHIVENSYLNGTVLRLDGAVRLPPR